MADAWTVNYYRDEKLRAWADVQRHRAQPGYDTMLKTHEGAVLWAKYLSASASLLGAEIERHAWEIRDRNTKALGRMYGKASRTIACQRDEIARLRLHIKAARSKCTCRAWWDVCDELKDEEQLRSELERTRQQLRAARDVMQFNREEPRCSCAHFWSDHDDGGRCGYTWDKWVGQRMVKQHCHVDCQKFRPLQRKGA